MKVNVETYIEAAPAEKNWVAVYADLFKARLTLLVLLTTMVGFYVGHRGPMDYVLMFHTLIGTALLASGAAALNQLYERDYDARMQRTQDRPLPSGRLQPATVLWVGYTLAAIGLVQLALLSNLTTAVLGALSFVSYVFIYTPLKRLTWMNTLVGAVPGALPPLMGWTAAQGQISLAGLSLFAVLAFWQLPHFFAIAWMYRGEYQKAGFKMLPSVDDGGRRTARQTLWYTALLVLASLCPFFFRLTGPWYFVLALTLGGAFFWCALQFARYLNMSGARRLFFASIIYLPLLLGVMVIDKLK